MAQCWTIILYFTMVFNLNYGPFGSGSWYADKKRWLMEFMDKCSSHSSFFMKYAGRIAKAPDHLQKLNTVMTIHEPSPNIVRKMA